MKGNMSDMAPIGRQDERQHITGKQIELLTARKKYKTRTRTIAKLDGVAPVQLHH